MKRYIKRYEGYIKKVRNMLSERKTVVSALCLLLIVFPSTKNLIVYIKFCETLQSCNFITSEVTKQ